MAVQPFGRCRTCGSALSASNEKLQRVRSVSTAALTERQSTHEAQQQEHHENVLWKSQMRLRGVKEAIGALIALHAAKIAGCRYDDLQEEEVLDLTQLQSLHREAEFLAMGQLIWDPDETDAGQAAIRWAAGVATRAGIPMAEASTAVEVAAELSAAGASPEKITAAVLSKVAELVARPVLPWDSAVHWQRRIAVRAKLMSIDLAAIEERYQAALPAAAAAAVRAVAGADGESYSDYAHLYKADLEGDAVRACAQRRARRCAFAAPAGDDSGLQRGVQEVSWPGVSWQRFKLICCCCTSPLAGCWKTGSE